MGDGELLSGVKDQAAAPKQHYAVLDGLRGTAALLVVLFHIQGITVMFEGAKVFFHHAPLAVDFFFVLSGFVVSYAYDDRWGTMGPGRFVLLRLIRLHPLVLIGVALGVISYLADPFAGSAQVVSASRLVVAIAMGMLVLPSWSLPNRWTDTHPFNGPCWSLFQEYCGNLAYAFVLRHLPTRWLGVVALSFAVPLTWAALSAGTLDLGSYWETFNDAVLRMGFSFTAGLWLFRVRDTLHVPKVGFLPLSLALVLLVICPIWPELGGIKLNGAYEALCVIVAFPLIILSGAHSSAGQGLSKVCGFTGRISYPIYITHFPFLYVWMNYVVNAQPSTARMIAIGAALVPFLIGVAWLALVAWDQPVRAWLSRRLLGSNVAPGN